MFCSNCGNEIPDDARFCSFCGREIKGAVLIKERELNVEVRDEPKWNLELREESIPQDKKTKRKRKPVTKERISENISKDSSGNFKWTCERSLFKDLTIFWLCFKVLIGTTVGVMLIITLITAIADGFSAASLRFMGNGVLGMAGIMTLLLCLGYLLYAAMMGGKYIVDFTMNDRELIHAQTAKQAEKAKKIGILTIIAGMFSRRMSTVGVGMNAARSISTTSFSSVKKVTADGKRCIIKLWDGESNYVYTAREDFAFVRGFIREHVNSEVKWIEK